MILAGFSILIDKLTRLSMPLLALMLLIFAFAVHLPAMLNAEGTGKATVEMIQILKNVGLSAGALLAAAASSALDRLSSANA